jgi:hypothetical protein
MYRVLKVAVHEAQLNGMKLIANKITEDEYEIETERIVDEVYTKIASQEPKYESEVI